MDGFWKNLHNPMKAGVREIIPSPAPGAIHVFGRKAKLSGPCEHFEFIRDRPRRAGAFTEHAGETRLVH